MSKTVKKIMDNDFIIRIRPFLDENDEWTGEIDLSIMTQPGNILTEDDHFQLMHFTKMIASSVPVMEDNDEIRELVHNYVLDIVDKQHIELKLEPNGSGEPKIVNIDNNVISIDFKTRGNA
tara:strand:- start:397 stop:759 length:363 start_codon:yes stop_codon:yes gene_type:complete